MAEMPSESLDSALLLKNSSQRVLNLNKLLGISYTLKTSTLKWTQSPRKQLSSNQKQLLVLNTEHRFQPESALG